MDGGLKLKPGDDFVLLPQEVHQLWQVVYCQPINHKRLVYDLHQTPLETILSLRTKHKDKPLRGTPELYALHFDASNHEKQGIYLYPAVDCDCEVKVRYTVMKEV